MALNNKPAFKKWISLLAGLGFLVFILYFLFFTDLSQVAVVIEGVSVPIYLLAFVCVICDALFNALTWKATLDAVEVKTTFRRVFNLGWVGAFVDCLIPGGLAGDLFMTYLLSKDKGVDGAKALASVIIKDVLELVVVLASVIIGMIFLVLNYSVNSFLLIAIGLTMVFLALPLILIVYLSTNVSATKRLLGILVRVMAKVRSKPFDTADLENKITEFHDGIMSMKKKPKAMVKPIVFQSITWVFEILALFFVFVALGSQIGIDKIVITNTVVSNIRGQGVALAGFSQIVSSQLYGILGINLSLAQASSLLAGLANFWFRLIIAFVFFQMYGIGTIAEKIANRAFKEKTKKDKKDFKKQTDSNQRDFEEKTLSERKDFEKLTDTNERTYKERKDSARRDFEEKTDTERKDFEKLTDTNERDYKEHKETNRKDFKEKTDTDRKDFEKLRDNNETDYQEHKDTTQKDFEEKTDSDKSDYKEQKDSNKKDFKVKTDKDKKDFENKKGSKEKTDNDQKDSEN
jgi:glycosyltransferase 2 family protein